MRFALTALLFVGGLIFTIYGLAFLFMPATIGEGFGLAPDSAQGWATLRADMSAFFIVGGVCMIVGGWRRSGDVLLVPAMLFGIALVGRLVGLAMDGAYEQFWMPMMVEAAVVAISLAGHQLLPHHKMDEITS
ncbi:MAG TPA: hypothetical protein VLA37_07495 [Sphingomonadaceae bacterium]|nr:hypothetical protein [Sphingomonadaceae bacterium]